MTLDEWIEKHLFAQEFLKEVDCHLDVLIPLGEMEILEREEMMKSLKRMIMISFRDKVSTLLYKDEK